MGHLPALSWDPSRACVISLPEAVLRAFLPMPGVRCLVSGMSIHKQFSLFPVVSGSGGFLL